MKVLDMGSAKSVSGGDLAVTVNITVPTADTTAFANMLEAYLTGQVVDAGSFVQQINNAAANFTDMKVNSITIGNFVIKPQQSQ